MSPPSELTQTRPGEPPPPQRPQWTSSARRLAFEAWLDQCSPRFLLQPDTLCVASADASFRRYFRLWNGQGASFIIMDAPPEKENTQAFVKVAHLMQQGGIAVPEILAWSEAQGFMLLTDMGQNTLMQWLHTTPTVVQIQGHFLHAIDLLVRWQSMAGSANNHAQLPVYNKTLLMQELQLFPQWYVQQHRSITLSDKQKAQWDQLCQRLLAHNLSVPSVYVHRDFMPRNLMLSNEGKLGVLDFQDAVYGPITYDIASLMRDAFWTWDEDFVLDITVRYWQAAKAAGLSFSCNEEGDLNDDFSLFYKAVEWMGLQRHLKILGIFARLSLRDGKPKYLADTPRFVAYVRQTASRYRELAPLMRLIEAIEGIAPQAVYAFGRA